MQLDFVSLTKLDEKYKIHIKKFILFTKNFHLNFFINGRKKTDGFVKARQLQSSEN
jgi:hypothetical protein